MFAAALVVAAAGAVCGSGDHKGRSHGNDVGCRRSVQQARRRRWCFKWL